MRTNTRLRYAEPQRLYFTDVSGRVWRVYDTRVWAGHHRPVRLGSPASHRIFVAADGMRRVYAFSRSEVHKLAVWHLDRQLREAGNKPAEVPNPNSWTDPW